MNLSWPPHLSVGCMMLEAREPSGGSGLVASRTSGRCCLLCHSAVTIWPWWKTPPWYRLHSVPPSPILMLVKSHPIRLCFVLMEQVLKVTKCLLPVLLCCCLMVLFSSPCRIVFRRAWNSSLPSATTFSSAAPPWWEIYQSPTSSGGMMPSNKQSH